MQGPPTPAEDDEASVPMETVRNGPNLNRTFTVRRKAAKRILPWDLPVDEIQLALPRQHEYIPARKKPRLEENLPTPTDETAIKVPSHAPTKGRERRPLPVIAIDNIIVAIPILPNGFLENREEDNGLHVAKSKADRSEDSRKTPSPDISIGLPPPAADNDDVNADPVTDSQPNAGEIKLVVPPPQDEDIQETKRPRLEKAFSSSRDEATTENTSHDATVALPPPDAIAAAAGDSADSDPVMDMQPNAGATGRHWTREEDTNLTSAVENTLKKKWGKEYKTDWVAIASWVPGRTKEQCRSRWYSTLDPIIGRSTARAGKWTADEDKMLKDVIPAHGTKNWAAIAALVPGRTKVQCSSRWRDALDPSIGWMTARTGKWTADEDKMLKDAALAHGGKNWEAISALVPDRTKVQCRNRWLNALDPNISRTTVRAGQWTVDEDKMLKDAVPTHGSRNWEAIAALVPGRTKVQCCKRWYNALVSSIDPTTARTGKWTAEEDKKLKDAAHTHNGKNWETIAALVPGRTKIQCCKRWHNALDPNIGRTTARVCKWTADEVKKLKDAVLAHDGKNWEAIAALVPDRTKVQCRNRWHYALDPRSDPTTARAVDGQQTMARS
jgi:hypothetical protein